MALINITQVSRLALQTLGKTSHPGGVALFSYKRNRKIVLSWCADSSINFLEDGYIKEEKTVSEESLPKILKSAIKREFPRSRKVRVYKFHDENDLKTAYKKL